MKAIRHIIAWFVPLALMACTTDDTAGQDEGTVSDDAVQLFAQVNTNTTSESSSNVAVYEQEFINLHFNQDLTDDNKEGFNYDQIYIVNTGASRTPDFNDDTKAYKYKVTGEYTFLTDEEKENDEVPYDENRYRKYVIEPADGETKLIKWTNLTASNSFYTLEGAFYPTVPRVGGTNYMERYTGKSDNDEENLTVPFDQRTDNNTVKRADLMLAHKTIHITDRGKEIHLQFRHVFCLVHVKLILPKYNAQTNPTGFVMPDIDNKTREDALKEAPEVHLADFNNRFSYNYDATKSDDGIIEVTADNSTRSSTGDFIMCPTNIEDNLTVDGKSGYFGCNYLAIVPRQNIDNTGTKSLLRFKLKKIKSGKDTYEYYRYIPRSTNIQIEQGMMTRLDLKIEPDNINPILIKAKLLNWEPACSEKFELEEETTTN